MQNLELIEGLVREGFSREEAISMIETVEYIDQHIERGGM